MFLRPCLVRAALPCRRVIYHQHQHISSPLLLLRTQSHFRGFATSQRVFDSKDKDKATSDPKHPDNEVDKATMGAQQAAVDLGQERDIETIARAQSISTRRASDDRKPDFHLRKPGAARTSSGKKKEGKLLSTPSRLLKLILPLEPLDKGGPYSDEPLALLAHPHQPLSYLERLLQAELPPIETKNTVRPPDIRFLARAPRDPSSPDAPTTEPSETHPDLVRFSPATETGDFLRDASKANFFLLQIEGVDEPIKVSVPSFQDRTYFLRQRLRATAAQIATESKIKEECDKLAQRGAQRVALSGFVGLLGWWGAVTWATFWTDLGWDVMEPVTYLVGLSGVISGYLWFLYHNREVSYRSVLHLTVSRRQMRLYDERGFDLERWHELLEEGKRIRKEIRMVAEEYDVEWDEKKDELISSRVKKELDVSEQKAERKSMERETKVGMDEEEEEEEEVRQAEKKE